MLGLMYVSGKGVPQNYVAAHMWLSLSAAQGDQTAEKRRDQIARLMTTAQVAEAQILASEWRPNTARAESTPSPKQPDAGEMSGTAFFVSNSGEMLTNAHVVQNCRKIRVAESPARLLARDNANDLALLAADLHPARWANWRQSVRQGEDIVVYGFPLAGVLSSGGNVVTGNVTALAGLGDDSRFLQISAPIQPGNSGGPLLDRNGIVVGIVVPKLDTLRIASATGDIPQNVNFAIKSSVAITFLDTQRGRSPVITLTPVEGDSFEGQMVKPRALSTADLNTQAQALVAQVVCVR